MINIVELEKTREFDGNEVKIFERIWMTSKNEI